VILFTSGGLGLGLVTLVLVLRIGLVYITGTGLAVDGAENSGWQRSLEEDCLWCDQSSYRGWL